MGFFHKSIPKGTILKLRKRFAALLSERQKLREHNKNLDISLVSTRKRVEDLNEQIKTLKDGNSETVRELAESKKQLILMQKQMAVSLKPNKDIKQAEEESERLAKELVIEEENLAKLIKKAKLLNTVIIRDVKSVMDKYEFLRYSPINLTFGKKVSKGQMENMRNEEFRELENEKGKTIYPAGGDFSEEQKKEFEKRGIKITLRSADFDEIQRGFVNLVKLNNLFDKLSGLVDRELVETKLLLEADDFIKRKVMDKYEDVYSDFVRKDDFFFEENSLKALENGKLEEHHIESINTTVIEIIKEIILTLGATKEMLGSRAIGVLFKEYDRIQPGVVKRINELFRLVVDEINKNDKLVKKLVELEDTEIQEVEEAFKKYLKDEARDIKAIRKNI